MATTLKDIELLIISLVVDNGELTTPEIVDLSLATIEDADEKTPQQIERMVTKLDRAGTLTRQNSEVGWQITANGKNALDGLRQKMERRFIAPYNNYAMVRAQFRLLTPSLGCVTEPGGVGISRFLRVNEEVQYVEREVTQTRRGKTTKSKITEREVVTPGQIIFLGGYILGAMMRAAHRSDPVVSLDDQGVRSVLPDAAWTRVTVRPILLPPDQQLIRSVRRPTNTSGMAVGEIVHESLPAGTILPIEAVFPLSHFSEQYLISLFMALEAVGISAAGTGRGGMWGVGMVDSLTVNGREVWPAAVPSYATITQQYAVTGLRGEAQNVLDYDQARVTSPAVDGDESTTTEAPAEARDDERSAEHPIPCAAEMNECADPVVSRLKPRSKVHRAGPAYAGANGHGE